MDISTKKIFRIRKNAIKFIFNKNSIRKVSIAIALIIAAHLIGTFLYKLANYFAIDKIKSTDPDKRKHRELVFSLIGSFLYWSIMLTVLISIPLWVGVQTSSLVAVAIAIIVAIAIGLQGTLSDLAAGIMLMFSDSFKLNDYIEIPSLSIIGLVSSFGVLNTRIVDEDTGVRVVVPNRSLYENAVVNHTSAQQHVVVIEVMVSNKNSSLKEVLKMLRDNVQGFPGILNKTGFEVTCNIAEVTAFGTKIEVRVTLSPNDFQVHGTVSKRTEIMTFVRESLISMGVDLVDLTRTQLYSSDEPK